MSFFISSSLHGIFVCLKTRQSSSSCVAAAGCSVTSGKKTHGLSTRVSPLSGPWMPRLRRKTMCMAHGVNASSEDLVKGLAFSCTECGACCTGSGHVWLNSAEASAMAEHVGDDSSFIDTYCIPRENGWYVLKNADNSDACVFLDQETNHCKVYGARPLQCATYPWWPELVQSRKAWVREAENVCEGILLSDDDDDDHHPLVSAREAAAHLDAFCAYLDDT